MLYWIYSILELGIVLFALVTFVVGVILLVGGFLGAGRIAALIIGVIDMVLSAVIVFHMIVSWRTNG